MTKVSTTFPIPNGSSLIDLTQGPTPVFLTGHNGSSPVVTDFPNRLVNGTFDWKQTAKGTNQKPDALEFLNVTVKTMLPELSPLPDTVVYCAA